MTIWKYPLQDENRQMLLLPEGARVLTFQMQGHTAMIWALVDPDATLKERYFRIVGTGHPDAPADGYIGTLQDGQYVWHLFEAK